MTTTISPSLGHGPWTQQGTGASPGYDAIDVRRLQQGIAAEGVLSAGSYAVTQRGAGANMSVDIAASTGEGARVQGDAVTLQALYYVPPHSAVINETIATADATNPRNDLVILEIKDTQHDASGSNLAQTRVITGTPNASAAQTDALGTNGTPSLPASAIPLAVVNVPATDTSITTSQVDDRRTTLWRTGAGGVLSIPGAESRTNAAYGKMTTPDQIKNVVLPTDGLILISYRALWKNSGAGSTDAAIFLSGNQIKRWQSSGVPTVQAVNLANGNTNYGILYTDNSQQSGLASLTSGGVDSSFVTTGQHMQGGAVVLEAAAGTYDVSIQFRGSGGGTSTVSDRRLRVWTVGFG